MNRHTILHLDSGHAWPELGDFAGDFASEYVRQLDDVVRRSLASPQIAAVYAAGAHSHHNFTRTGNLIRNILIDKNFRSTVFVELRCFHGTLSSGAQFNIEWSVT